MKKHHKYLVPLLSGVISLLVVNCSQAATEVTVGDSSDYDYQSIQTAIDQAGATDTIIKINPGTYSENLEISAGQQITLSNVEEDATLTIIKGKIKIKKNAELTVDSLKINAAEKKIGLKVSGLVVFTNSIVRKARTDVKVTTNGTFHSSGSKIIKATQNGVFLKGAADVYLESITLKKNKVGLKAKQNSLVFTLRQSDITQNTTAIKIIDSLVENSIALNVFSGNAENYSLDDSRIDDYNNDYQ